MKILITFLILSLNIFNVLAEEITIPEDKKLEVIDKKQAEKLAKKEARKAARAIRLANEYGLQANFKRIALDFSMTDVHNGGRYENSTIVPLSANDEMIIKGTFDFILEYKQPKYQWDNKLFMVYGKTTVNKRDGERTISENADEISVITDFSSKLWKAKTADAGIFTNIGYQTEFTKDTDYRNQIIRGKLGIRLFNGKYLKDIYITNVGEFDLTFDKEISKYAIEIGTNIEYKVNNNVKFNLEGYFRDYIAYSRYNPDDLNYDLNFVFRMNVKVIGVFSISPFVSLRQAKIRSLNHSARNIMFGISIVFADIIKI